MISFCSDKVLEYLFSNDGGCKELYKLYNKLSCDEEKEEFKCFLNYHLCRIYNCEPSTNIKLCFNNIYRTLKQDSLNNKHNLSNKSKEDCLSLKMTSDDPSVKMNWKYVFQKNVNPHEMINTNHRTRDLVNLFHFLQNHPIFRQDPKQNDLIVNTTLILIQQWTRSQKMNPSQIGNSGSITSTLCFENIKRGMENVKKAVANGPIEEHLDTIGRVLFELPLKNDTFEIIENHIL